MLVEAASCCFAVRGGLIYVSCRFIIDKVIGNRGSSLEKNPETYKMQLATHDATLSKIILVLMYVYVSTCTKVSRCMRVRLYKHVIL